jgi:hypothetical protein
MSRNSINLFLAGTILLLVTACFCPSGRDNDPVVDDDPPPASNKSSVSNTAPASTTGKRKDEGDFKVEHLDVTTPRYVEIDKQVKSENLLEDAAARLNKALILPHDLYLRTKDCQEINAFYDPNDHSVTMCYELMEHFYRTFQAAGDTQEKSYDKMFDAVHFVFLHEIGHALIDAYKLPVTGNEEDAADRLSAWVNLTELGEEGVRAIFAAADAFAIESKMRKPGARHMADEHLLQEQRFYNSLCMIYGSNEEKYAYIVTDGYLPKERAVRCPGEYQKTVDSWVKLLAEWRKSQ